MSCNCKTDLEAELLERWKAKRPELTDHHVELQGFAIAIVGNQGVVRGCMPVSASGLRPPKTPRSTPSVVREKQTMMFSYCPFCGTPADGGPSRQELVDALGTMDTAFRGVDQMVDDLAQSAELTPAEKRQQRRCVAQANAAQHIYLKAIKK